MSGRHMWLVFVALLALWASSVVTGAGGVLAHLLLVLAVLDLATVIGRSRSA